MYVVKTAKEKKKKRLAQERDLTLETLPLSSSCPLRAQLFSGVRFFKAQASPPFLGCSL